MRSCWPRQLLSIVLVFSFSFATLAVDAPGTAMGMLHASGKVEVNRADSPRTMALFSGDSVETEKDSVANITAGGTSVLVMPNSSVRVQGHAVEVSRGDIVVATSAGMTAKADDFVITPAAQKQSKFEVAENDESVTVAAQQGNVSVSDGQQSSTVQEGQQTTREKKKKKGAGAAPGGSGGLSGKTTGILLAGAGAAAAVGIAIATTNSSTKCVSPSGDKKFKCDNNQPANNNCQ
jgi:hypothetical protein